MKNAATIEMKNTNVMNHTTNGNASHLSATFRRLALRLAAIVSLILGEKVSPAYSLCLLNVLTSGTCAFLFGGASTMIQVLLIVWFVVAIWQTRLVKKS